MGDYLFTLCSLTSLIIELMIFEIITNLCLTPETQPLTSESVFYLCIVFLNNSQLGQTCCSMLPLSGDTEWGKQRDPGSPMCVNESERGCLCNCGIYNWTVNSLTQVTFLLVRTTRLEKGQGGSWGGTMEVEPSLWPHCTGELVETEQCAW